MAGKGISKNKSKYVGAAAVSLSCIQTFLSRTDCDRVLSAATVTLTKFAPICQNEARVGVRVRVRVRVRARV